MLREAEAAPSEAEVPPPDRLGESRRGVLRWIERPEAMVVLMTAAWSLALQIVTLTGSAFLDPTRRPGLSAFGSAWQQWDGNWFARIVTLGYHAGAVNHYFQQAAFYPGFPLVARGVYEVIHPLGMGIAVAMVMTNQLVVFALTILVYRLAVALTEDHEAALRTVKYLLLFPFAYFLLAPFSEAIFLTAVAGFSWALMTRRYMLAGLFAGLASGTRLVGIVLALVLLVGYLEQHAWRLRSLRPRVVVAAVIGLWGAVAYAVYQLVVFKDALYSQGASKLWARELNLAVWQPLQAMFVHGDKPTAGYLLGTPLEVFEILPLLAAFVVLTWLVWRRFGVALGLMCALLIIVPLVSNSMLSFNRYLLPLLPCFVILGRWGRRQAFDVVYSMLGGALLVMFLMMYSHGVWTG